jgi:hypothetical protein
MEYSSPFDSAVTSLRNVMLTDGRKTESSTLQFPTYTDDKWPQAQLPEILV